MDGYGKGFLFQKEPLPAFVPVFIHFKRLTKLWFARILFMRGARNDVEGRLRAWHTGRRTRFWHLRRSALSAADFSCFDGFFRRIMGIYSVGCIKSAVGGFLCLRKVRASADNQAKSTASNSTFCNDCNLQQSSAMKTSKKSSSVAELPNKEAWQKAMLFRNDCKLQQSSMMKASKKSPSVAE